MYRKSNPCKRCSKCMMKLMNVPIHKLCMQDSMHNPCPSIYKYINDENAFHKVEISKFKMIHYFGETILKIKYEKNCSEEPSTKAVY
mmetsp:Transcript_14357/g.18611  ORF Transcript_14357/g.18611 Transcript_14357/m.18611 type:complete len:87 (+) Transcript_14357:884-1144(+)